MLIISQYSWGASDIAALEAHVTETAAFVRRRQPTLELAPLMLLPRAEEVEHPPAMDDLLAAVGAVAGTANIQLAGAAPVQTDTGVRIVGFVVSETGDTLLSTPKISPDLVTGIGPDATSDLGVPASFQVAATSVGQVGILSGEDILFAHYARALTWAGAEIILNPTVEISDHLIEGRATARVARAWENTVYVASAGAVGAGGTLGRPGCACLIDWNGTATHAADTAGILLPDLDIERLRRRRNAIFAVQPLHLRAPLYAEGYRRLIAARSGPLPSPPRGREAWIEEIDRRQKEAAAAHPGDSGQPRIDQYDALLTQTVGKIIQQGDDVVKMRRENIEHSMTLAGRMASSPGIKLVVAGEFFMHGQGGHGFRSPETLERLAIRYPGPELELLQNFASKHDVYVAGSSFEIDDKLPGHIFNSAYIIDDTGELIHRYRKIQCADVWGSLPDTTPGSIYDRYLDIYGYDFLFPVADTPIGRLGTMVCFDQAHPEIARMLTKYGAEVIVHPSSEGHGCGRAGWNAARASRAFENTAYVLSAMPGGEYFKPSSDDLPTTQMRGHSRIISFDGSVQGVADSSGACVLTGTVDLKALRRARSDAMAHLPLWDDPEVYADIYAGEFGLENNLWGDDPQVNPYVGFLPLKERLESYYERGIFVRPAGVKPGDIPASSKVYGPAGKKIGSTSLADQDKLDGESIQI
jgi:predicted amidohydrolase